jgi:hypothetical protein
MNKAYALLDGDFDALRDINKRLFGDGTHMSADTRRDLANRMHVILLRAIKMELEIDDMEGL